MQKPTAFLLLFIVFATGCIDSSKVKKSEILSDDEFIEIMIDLHKADGIIFLKNLQSKDKQRDSISLYNYILKKHNVSRLKFSKTVQYYSLHIEEYNLFYDSISNYFAQLQDELKKEVEKERIKQQKEQPKDSTNLWILKDKWELPRDGETNPIAFKNPANKHGTYTLKASIKIYKDDKSVNLRMTIIANYTDGSKDLNSVGSMIKDGRFERYEVSINTDNSKRLKSISGWILDHSKGTKSKHCSVKDIELKLFEDETHMR